LAESLTEQTDKCKQYKQNLLKRKAELLADIQIFRKEINDHLDKLEKTSVKEIEDKFEALVIKIENEMKQLHSIKARVTSAYDKLAFQNKSEADEFVCVKKGQDVASKSRIKDSTTKGELMDIEFQPYNEICLQLKQKGSLGKCMAAADELLQTHTKTSYSVEEKSDPSFCDIISVCCTDDGVIIVADQNNRRLKRLDKNTFTVTDYYELHGRPYQVSSIRQGQLAVTVRPRKVQYVSLERQMKTEMHITTDFDCYGLAYANHNLYITDKNTSVYVYTLSGLKLKQYRMERQVFLDIVSLAVNPYTSRIYVSDYDNGLIELDQKGQVVRTFDDEQLHGTSCCVPLETDGLLVSGCDSKNVLQITSNGVLVAEVVRACKEKRGILAICCNKQISKMFVCRTLKNKIDVYDICKVNWFDK
jgi:hypothetical protein